MLNIVASSCIHFPTNDVTSFSFVAKNSTVYKSRFLTHSSVVGQVVYNLAIVTSAAGNTGQYFSDRLTWSPLTEYPGAVYMVYGIWRSLCCVVDLFS